MICAYADFHSSNFFPHWCFHSGGKSLDKNQKPGKSVSFLSSSPLPITRITYFFLSEEEECWTRAHTYSGLQITFPIWSNDTETYNVLKKFWDVFSEVVSEVTETSLPTDFLWTRTRCEKKMRNYLPPEENPSLPTEKYFQETKQ